jgi:hypothetical protein
MGSLEHNHPHNPWHFILWPQYTDKNAVNVKYLRCWTIDVWLVHLNCVMFQSKHIVRENNGFVTSSLMVSYQILCAAELAGVHHVQELEDTSKCLVNQAIRSREGRPTKTCDNWHLISKIYPHILDENRSELLHYRIHHFPHWNRLESFHGFIQGTKFIWPLLFVASQTVLHGAGVFNELQNVQIYNTVTFTQISKPVYSITVWKIFQSSSKLMSIDSNKNVIISACLLL